LEGKWRDDDEKKEQQKDRKRQKKMAQLNLPMTIVQVVVFKLMQLGA
jgi:hypothetical protein